jgi:hypothetical protein
MLASYTNIKIKVKPKLKSLTSSNLLNIFRPRRQPPLLFGLTSVPVIDSSYSAGNVAQDQIHIVPGPTTTPNAGTAGPSQIVWRPTRETIIGSLAGGLHGSPDMMVDTISRYCRNICISWENVTVTVSDQLHSLG